MRTIATSDGWRVMLRLIAEGARDVSARCRGAVGERRVALDLEL